MAFQLELEKFVFLLTSVWSARCPNAFEQILSGEVMTMLDDLMQLYAALDGSEQELRNKISTVAQLSRRLLTRGERIYWPEKIEPEFSQLFLEHNVKLAGKELETIVWVRQPFYSRKV
uniref:uncharacterized protein LOC105349367 n=1 Tax=Fragaria vesca subsp. vesca TaxID=101020 RepID=UPI0005CAB290|nr:PREDICTED: uncharacterized protein LOC105349367 [Fragaria vesca subsp. vesca]